MTTPLSGFGLTADLPAAWEGRIFRRPTPAAEFSPANTAQDSTRRGAAPGRIGWLGEKTRAIMHLGNFALPSDRGDFGSGAVELMGAQNCFIGLLEFGPECLGTALYAPTGLPRVDAGRFDPNGLQRRLPGQSGYQHFFTAANRPLCLYVVLGGHLNAVALSRQVNIVLDGISVEGL